LVVGTDDEVKEVKAFLATKFKIKDMGNVSIFTGLLLNKIGPREQSKYHKLTTQNKLLMHIACKTAIQY